MARIDREQLGELLSGYIDGELDARERQIIERVLREDESARQLLADLQRTSQAISSLPRHAAPASVAADIQAALERTALLEDFPQPQAHHTRVRSSWTARMAMAAMVGLVVLTGWWYTAGQTRRDRAAQLAQNKRDARQTDAVKERADLRSSVEESAVAHVSKSINAPSGGILSGPGRDSTAALATVEQQLAAGVEPSSLRGQTFAAEPVRLQVAVRNRTEREAVTANIAAALSNQRVTDLAVNSGWRADAPPSDQRFYIRGESGVNFKAAGEDQILVHASPQQIDGVLNELSASGHAVALVAGPIAVQGVDKSRSVVQLLGEQRQAAASPAEEKLGRLSSERIAALADEKPPAPADGANGGSLEGLLKIIGIDPKLVDSADKSAATESESSGFRRNEADVVASADDAAKEPTVGGKEGERVAAKSAAPVAERQPPAPPPLVDRRLQEAVGSRQPADKDAAAQPAESPQANLTVVVQIIEQSSPAKPRDPKN